MAWYASNTGVPAGTTLTTSGIPAPIDGHIYLDQAGATYDAKEFNAPQQVHVRATNVTITRSRIYGNVIGYPGTALTISDCEISGERYDPVCNPDLGVDAVRLCALDAQGSLIGERLNLHHFGRAVNSRGNVTVTDSWGHGFPFGYCNSGGQPSHIEAVFIFGGGSYTTLRRNFFDAAYDPVGTAIGGQFSTACIFHNGEPHSHNTFDSNWFSGGGYTLYAGNASATYMQWTNNAFLTDANFPQCGIFGPVTAFFSNTGVVWSGNVWADRTGNVTGTLEI